MPDFPEIKPFQAYSAISFGMKHYYFQHPDCVIHVNTHGPLINRLDALHLVRNEMDHQLEEVPTDEYLATANHALEQMGFDTLSMDQVTSVRLN